MFICEECGEVFEEPNVYKEHHPYGMGFATEYFAVCPCCNDTSISEAKRCDVCGEWFAKLHDDLCDECESEVAEID